MTPERPTTRSENSGGSTAEGRDQALRIFRVTGVHDTHDSAVSKDLMVVVFYGDTQASAVRTLLAEMHSAARGNNRMMSIITVVKPEAPMPEREARMALQDGFVNMIKDGVNIQSAVVFEGLGAKMILVRGVVTALSIMTRSALRMLRDGMGRASRRYKVPTNLLFPLSLQNLTSGMPIFRRQVRHRARRSLT